MNDLACRGWFAEKLMNTPEKPLTTRTSTPTTQNHGPLFINKARLRE
jgi:hypothetical protein